MHRLPGGLVCHQFDALQPEDIGDLVRVDEHAGGAVRQDRPHKLGHGQHARFDVHMPIQQARHQVLAVCFDDACLLADGMGGIRADIGDPTILDGNIGLRHELAGLHADPGAFAQHQVGRLAAHGNIDQSADRFDVRFHATPGNLGKLHGS